MQWSSLGIIDQKLKSLWNNIYFYLFVKEHFEKRELESHTTTIGSQFHLLLTVMLYETACRTTEHSHIVYDAFWYFAAFLKEQPF